MYAEPSSAALDAETVTEPSPEGCAITPTFPWLGPLGMFAYLPAKFRVRFLEPVDSSEPTRKLERTEFVKVGNQHSLIERIVHAAELDTVVDTRLVVNSMTTSPRAAHENNVIGTMNVLAACAGKDSPVRKFVFKSSALYCGREQDDPAFFTEEMTRPHPPRTEIERDVVEAEESVSEFMLKRPEMTVTVLRCANVLGPDVQTAHTRMLSLPAVRTTSPADGVLALSEVIGLLGKRPLPLLPPWGTGAIAGPLRRLGLRIPDEMLNQLRFGRGVDNRRFKAAGFRYELTTREAVLWFAEHLRLHPVKRGAESAYTYEREVEEFLRWSPHVQRERRDEEPLGL